MYQTQGAGREGVGRDGLTRREMGQWRGWAKVWKATRMKQGELSLAKTVQGDDGGVLPESDADSSVSEPTKNSNSKSKALPADRSSANSAEAARMKEERRGGEGDGDGVDVDGSTRTRQGIEEDLGEVLEVLGFRLDAHIPFVGVIRPRYPGAMFSLLASESKLHRVLRFLFGVSDVGIDTLRFRVARVGVEGRRAPLEIGARAGIVLGRLLGSCGYGRGSCG
ncbi:hypothetical protein BKA62DRAFT_712953 [Auriculariales sp. MPI-PUGE-AT-0066]|nr:hypothetical protein BKA62DRAFT_712953 [Auriculariales sp. MPI-PUGE-AT-0066]